MATGTDRCVGAGMIGFSLIVFIYYTLWVVILPFVEKDHAIQQLFLPRAYAVIIPIVAGIVLLFILTIGFCLIMSKNKDRKKTK